MNLSVITACMFSSPRPIRTLQASCDKWGINLKPYGLGTTYTDWPDIKINRLLLKMLEERGNGATHILYTDGRDSFFLTGQDEIESKYRRMGSPPMLMAAETQCYPREWLADRFPDPGHHYRWPGSGQFMGEVDKLVRDWEWLRSTYAIASEDQNEQGWMVQAMADKKLDWELDHGCEIFQSAGNGDVSLNGELEIREVGIGRRRLYNVLTGSWPCAVHFNGGFSDPLEGKDVVILPAWEQLK
jgi:hypothetical protein